MKRELLSGLLICTLAVATWPDTVLDRAAATEKAGELETAASQLADWLSSNPGAAAAPEVFSSYLRVEQDLPRLLQTAATFLKTARGVSGAAAQFERIARLFDLAGRVEPARDAYLAAYAEGAPGSTLVSAFLLSLRMNDLQAMDAALQQVKGRGASSEILLQALSDLRKGDRAAARAALMGLSEQTGDPDLALKSLWVLYQSAQGAGDAAGQGDARARMEKRFAASPEAALAVPAPPKGASGRPVVLPAPVPDAFAPGTAPAAAPDSGAAPVTPASPPGASAPADPAPVTTLPVPSSPAASSAKAAAQRFSVQAGSFQMKENADDLVSELTRRGFTATLLRDSPQGTDRWRVFAGSGLERDAAEAVRKKLSGAGFLGFLVADK
jgi:cell division septation protein DedD